MMQLGRFFEAASCLPVLSFQRNTRSLTAALPTLRRLTGQKYEMDYGHLLYYAPSGGNVLQRLSRPSFRTRRFARHTCAAFPGMLASLFPECGRPDEPAQTC